MTLICDTGVVYAAAVKSDAEHAACAELLEAEHDVVVPAPVVVEMDWLSRARSVAQAGIALLRSIEDGSVAVAELEPSDYVRARKLVEDYADLPLDFVDAALISIAERFGERVIATLDRRHFSVVRPRHTRSFVLVP